MDNEDLKMIIKRIRDEDPEIQRQALQSLHEEIRTTQGTIAVRSQEILDVLVELCESLKYLKGDDLRHLYDLLSVMHMLESNQLVLRYRLNGGVTGLEEWGHQYVKKLATSIVDVVQMKIEYEEYEPLIEPIVDYLFKHNSEIEAIDFIIELSKIPLLTDEYKSKEGGIVDDINMKLQDNMKGDININNNINNNNIKLLNLIPSAVDNDNKERIINYLDEMSKFYNLENLLLEISKYDSSRFLVYLLKFNRRNEAIEMVQQIEDAKQKKQCLYILARNSVYYQYGKPEEEYILSNSHIKDTFLGVAESLEILAPKKLEYMFKGLNKERIDTAAIANALVHFGFGRDPVFINMEGDFRIKEEYSEQLKINKSISTVASVGLICAYDTPGVYDFHAERIFENPEIGAILALALSAHRSVDSDSSILSLLSCFLVSHNKNDVISAILGISIVYSGTNCQDVYGILFPLLSHSDEEISLFTIYVLGVVFTGDLDILSACIDVYEILKKDTPFSNLAILGLALFFYNKKTLNDKGRTIYSRLDKYAQILCSGFMHIGSGNPCVVDDILTEALTGETDALLESLGLLSCCLVGVGDSMATQLLERISTSSLLLDSAHLRNIVPLCISLIYASNPKSEIIDILEKSINSGDSIVNSLIALGIIGAGTGSSRILRIFDSNFTNIYKESKASSALIYAQGLVNLGKGLLSLSPLCYDKQIILHKGIVGLLSTSILFLDPSMFKDYPYLLYFITGSVVPKYVTGFDGSCKVGKPIDVVGMAGKPNKMSAAIVHTLPVVLNENERAETDDSVYTYYIEDVLVKNE